MADVVHPHIEATGKPDSSSHFLCPRAPGGQTHHLVPVGSVQTCKYCIKTDATIRKENGLA